MATEELIEKQKLIREGLAKGFYYKATGNNRWDSESDGVKEPHYTNADAVLTFLTEQGAVLKVGTRIADLPYTEFNSLAEQCAFEQGLKDMLKADYTATAPLIEE